MFRCLRLAKLGAGRVAPNPMVGAVLVHEGRIIGEGYHRQYGQAHAEVNCISQAVQNGHSKIVDRSSLYVSLEPCAHHGKTPPCADLIIKHGIPRVIIGCRDPFKEVDGKGIDKLKAAGVETVPGILENECRELNKRFFVFHTQHRPFIILKWAQTADGFIAPAVERAKGAIVNSKTKRLLISNEYTKRVVHKWRSEEAGILVGTNTALDDDPELTTRLWPGNSPVRFVVDMHLRLPSSLRIFDQSVPTIVFNSKMHSEGSNWLAAPMGERVKYYQVTEEVSLVHQVINALYQLKIQSVIVEGGTRLLQSFIDEGLWDEARVIRNGELAIGKGLPAPEFVPTEKTEEISFLQDKLTIYRNSGK